MPLQQARLTVASLTSRVCADLLTLALISINRALCLPAHISKPITCCVCVCVCVEVQRKARISQDPDVCDTMVPAKSFSCHFVTDRVWMLNAVGVKVEDFGWCGWFTGFDYHRHKLSSSSCCIMQNVWLHSLYASIRLYILPTLVSQECHYDLTDQNLVANWQRSGHYDLTKHIFIQKIQ